MERNAKLLIVFCMLPILFCSCAGNRKFRLSAEICVISREDGSGTRGAFVELFGVEQEAADGKKYDHTTEEASITNYTSVMMNSVSGDKHAIGYISLGSFNDTVKALKIDGAAPSAESIKSGEYKIVRPFNIAVKADLNEASSDFIKYILSLDGQAVVEAAGYVSLESDYSYIAGELGGGSVSIAGSSSVTPVMEKLKEAYIKLRPEVNIEIQQSDSTTGISAAAEGICDIGMVSRSLKESELSKGLIEECIAMDGIAVIVNKANTIDELSSRKVQEIFTGKITIWADAV